VLAGDFAIPVLADAVSFFNQIEPELLLRSNFHGRVHRNHGPANAGGQSIAFRCDAQVNPIALANLPVECRTDQRAVGGVGAHHDLKPVALGTQHAADPRAPGGDFGFETSGRRTASMARNIASPITHASEMRRISIALFSYFTR